MIRIGVICNALGALRSIEYLLQEQALVGVAIPSSNKACQALLQPASEEAGFVLARLEKSNLAAQLHEWIGQIEADAVLVLTFPYLIPEAVLDLPPRGFFNFHPGKLPAYRGPDPAFWEIAAREDEGALTVHKMTPEFDNGPIILTRTIPFGEGDTWGMHMADVFDEAREACAGLLTLFATQDDIPAAPQHEPVAGYQKMPTVDDRMIQWASWTSGHISALIRACNPMYDGALTYFRGAMIRILDAEPVILTQEPKLPAGTVVMANEDVLVLLCIDGRGIKLNAVATDEGFFGGSHFGLRFGVKLGERFHHPEPVLEPA